MDELEFDWDTDRTRFAARSTRAESSPPLAFVDVVLRGDTLVVLHTQTDPRHRGQGLADRLTHVLMDQARAEGWQVDAHCPYTVNWLGSHPEYADLTARQ